MAEVNVSINDKSYRIGCDPGEEARVEELASHIDQQVKSLGPASPGTAEAQLLVLGSIIMCDELFELRELLKNAQSQYEAVSQKLEQVTEQLEIEQNRSVEANGSAPESIDDPEIADIIAGLATRIEAIADRLHKS